MNDIVIERASVSDVEIIREIYNEAVLTTTATFDIEPVSFNNRHDWLIKRTEDFPVIVAKVAGEVVGYASLSRWSDRAAYDITAELSIYVSSEKRGQGIGTILLHKIIEAAKATNLHTVIVRITADNIISLKMHRAFGFVEVGVLKQCGIKFNQILDVVIMQKILKQ